MIVSQVVDAWFAVPIGSSEGNTTIMVKLNSTGEDIFDGLLEGKTVEESAHSLTEKNEIDPQKVLQSPWHVNNALKAKGILSAE